MRPSLTAFRRSGSRAAAAAFDAEMARLYQARFPGLYRYLDRSLGDAQLAADIAQEAFVRLFERGSLPDDPGAWLITVAINLARDDHRRSGRRRRLLEAAGIDAPRPAALPDPATAIERDQERDRVRAALDRLALREREVLLLRHSGYSYREIAAAFELTETNVGTILLRAGMAFQKAYEDLHGHPD